MTLLERSVYGAILILVILLVRAVMLHKLPKRIFPVLWGIALLRLLLPFEIAVQISVYSFLQQEVAEQIASAEMVWNGERGQEEPAESVLQYFADEGNLTKQSGTMHTQGKVSFSWFWAIQRVGMLVCAFVFALSYIRCMREFRMSLPVKDAFIDTWLETHVIYRKLTVRQSDRVATPLTYGVIRPVILLPKKLTGVDKKQLEYVLQHEYVHICNFDALYKVLLVAALCIHCFNPLVWCMVFVCNRDIELACDEQVLSKLGEGEKAGYARVLIAMEAKMSGYALAFNGFGKNAIEGRVKYIMRYKKSSVVTLVAGILVVVAVAVGFATSARDAEENIAEVDRTDLVEDIQVSEQVVAEKEQEPAENLNETIRGSEQGVAEKAKELVEKLNETIQGSEQAVAEKGQELAEKLQEAIWAEEKFNMIETAQVFWEAYRIRDTESLKQYLDKDYEGDITGFPTEDAYFNAETAKLIAVKGVNVTDKEVGDTCMVSLEFFPGVEGEAYKYLTLEFLKTEEGWNLISYNGLEG